VTAVGRPPWRPPLPINIEDLAVLQVLEDGQTHNRVDVAATLRISVRQVRRSVSELRRLGWPIGSALISASPTKAMASTTSAPRACCACSSRMPKSATFFAPRSASSNSV
jgi:hypothetical protein